MSRSLQEHFYIVKEKAEKYGLPYYSQKSYLQAIIEHTKMLKS